MSISRRGLLSLAGTSLFEAVASGVPLPASARRIGILGVPINPAGRHSGVARAPQALRQHGLIDKLRAVCDVRDFGDVQFASHDSVRDARSGIRAESPAHHGAGGAGRGSRRAAGRALSGGGGR